MPGGKRAKTVGIARRIAGQGHLFGDRKSLKVKTALYLFVVRGKRLLAMSDRLKTKDPARLPSSVGKRIDRAHWVTYRPVGS